MIRFWTLILVCFAVTLQAQQAVSPIDRCLATDVTLNEQILACDAAVRAEDASASKLAYLPPIITELRGGRGNFDAASEQIGEHAADGAYLLLAMGDAQVKAERYELAMVFFQVAKADYPDNEAVLKRLESFLDNIELLYDEDPNGLVALVTKGMEYGPHDPDLLSLRAEIFVQLGDMMRAQADWDVALNAAGYPHLVQFRRAKFLWESGIADEALAGLTVLAEELRPGGRHETLLLSERPSVTGYLKVINAQLLEFLPDERRDVLKLMTDINRAIGDNDAALMAAEEWLDSMPSDILGLSSRAQILSSLGRSSEALIAFDDLVEQAYQNEGSEIGADSELALLVRGQFYAREGNVVLAMSDLNKVLAESERSAIVGFQQYLSRIGVFHDEIDGIYGDGTKQAIARCIREPSCDLG